ncbi:hypothetical protein EDB80DRAFT_718582 [Ilyonectria destructans]|nr:hypothetical protein EDB80DRAFT_718582 [Ilyonectria destructans]
MTFTMANIDYYERLTERINFDNTPLLAAAGISFLVGYAQYAYAIGLTLREGKGPMPFWMHSLYLAHDSTWSYLFANAAPRYNGHWFFQATSVALFIWSALEVFCIHREITKNRKATFSSYFGPDPQLLPVVAYAAFLQMGMYAVVVIMILLMGEGCFMQWACLTNVVIALGPTSEYLKRGSREGLSLGFALVNIFGTIWTFVPFSFFALTIPEIFTQPAYYAMGVVVVAISVYDFFVVASYPKKKKPKYGPTPIW